MRRIYFVFSVLVLWGVLIVASVGFVQSSKAYFDFMAPGVPYKAMCEEVSVATSVVAYLQVPKNQIGDGETIEAKLYFKNKSPGVVYIGSYRLAIAYGSTNLKIETVSLNDLFQCGFRQQDSFVRNAEGLAVFTVDVQNNDECAPVALEANQELEVAVIKLYGTGDGTSFIRIIETGDTQFTDYTSYLMDARRPETNILTFENSTIQVVVGQGGKGEEAPVVTDTPLPTTPAPSTTVPATGVLDSGIGIIFAVMLLLLGILISYWDDLRELFVGNSDY